MPGMDPIESLRKIIAERGTGVLEQPELVENLMCDHCQGRRPEIAQLVASLKEEVPQRLLATVTVAHREAVIGQAREHMQLNLGMQPERAAWTVNAWLKVLPLPASEPRPSQPPPIPVVTFAPTEELRAFMRKRSGRWMFHPGWFKKVEDELVERGVPRAEATKMLNEYCGKRRRAPSEPAPREPFHPGKAVAKVGWFLLTIASFVGFGYFFGHPLTFVTRLPGFAAEMFHRAMAGDFMGAAAILGAGAVAAFLIFVCVEAKEKW